jgi:hypothetical protein
MDRQEVCKWHCQDFNRDGVLEVSIPKQAKLLPRRIQIAA